MSVVWSNDREINYSLVVLCLRRMSDAIGQTHNLMTTGSASDERSMVHTHESYRDL